MKMCSYAVIFVDIGSEAAAAGTDNVAVNAPFDAVAEDA